MTSLNALANPCGSALVSPESVAVLLEGVESNPELVSCASNSASIKYLASIYSTVSATYGHFLATSIDLIRVVFTITTLDMMIRSLLYGICLVALSAVDATQRPLADHGASQLLVTAILSHPEPPHHAYMQCVQVMSSKFHEYPTVGRAIYLSGAANTTLVELPPDSEEGWHRPPAPMWFVLLHGKAVVQTPWTGDEVVIEPPRADGSVREVSETGRIEPQMILALDTLGKGHLTFYPGSEATVALQIPLGASHGSLEWQIVRDGPC